MSLAAQSESSCTLNVMSLLLGVADRYVESSYGSTACFCLPERGKNVYTYIQPTLLPEAAIPLETSLIEPVRTGEYQPKCGLLPHSPCCTHHLSLLLQDSKHTYPDVSVLLAILSMFYEKTPAIHRRIHTLLVLCPRVGTEL